VRPFFPAYPIYYAVFPKKPALFRRKKYPADEFHRERQWQGRVYFDKVALCLKSHHIFPVFIFPFFPVFRKFNVFLEPLILMDLMDAI
jgi:hypothetical protein